MSSGDIKEPNRRDANNRWSVKMFVVNDEEQWWVENGERNIALCMSREDAECIVESHNLQNFGDDRFLAFIRQQEGRVMELLNTPIDALELTMRSSNCLEKGGIKTIGDLTRKTESDLAHIRHLGQKSLSEEAFKSSYDGQKGGNRFTKVRMDLDADRCLNRYFKNNLEKIISWFNIISPAERNLEELRSELNILSSKNWAEIYR
jgi:hypothetical protein